MVGDIINNGTKVLFILESPHTEEIKGDLPLLGKSGEVFSQAILRDKFTVAGIQINKGSIPYSILNTFQDALQTSSELSEINSFIKMLDFNKLKITQYKKQVGDIIKNSSVSSSLIKSYQERIKLAIINSDKSIKIVVCGVIAQVFFEIALDVENIRFGKITGKTIIDKYIKILYVEHPSPRNKQISHWGPDKGNSKLELLKKFVMYKV